MNIIILYCLLLACIHVYAQRCKIIECKYLEVNSLQVEQIDPTLCTHLTYTSLKVTEKIVYPDSQHAKEEMQIFGRMRALKNRNPQLKILLTIQPDPIDNFFFTMYKNSTLRRHFIEETIRFIRQIAFDGTEFNIRASTFYHRINEKLSDVHFITLMKELSEAYTAERLKSKMPKLILTTVASPGLYIDYDMVGVLRYLDYIIVDIIKTYKAFRHSSPLYGADKNDSYSIDYFTRYLVNKGYVKQKLVLVLHLSGNHYINRCWGKFKGLFPFGNIDYKDVCKLLKTRVPLFDEIEMVSYLKTNDDGVMYNSQFIMQIKVVYVKMHGLGGISVSTLSMDDYTGACNKGKFPLTNAAVHECRIG